MNRQSGSQAPIPVTPKEVVGSPSQQPLLQGQFPAPLQKPKRRSRDGRLSWLTTGRQRSAPIWRPSHAGPAATAAQATATATATAPAPAPAPAPAHTTKPSPPTPHWPLPRVPLNIRDANPALTMTYTLPRSAPQPPPPATAPGLYSPRASDDSGGDKLSGSGSTRTLTNDRGRFPPRSHGHERSQSAPAHPLSPRAPPSLSSPARPPYFPSAQHGGNNNQFQTRYMNMLLGTQRIPRSHNILSNLFAWMILLSFVLAPGSFTSPSSPSSSTTTTSDKSQQQHRGGIPSVPLLAVTAALFGLGALGTAHLALRWRRNHVWLLNRVYLPLTLHSLAGLLACLASVAVQHRAVWSPAAYAAVAVEGATLLASGGLFVLTDRMLLGALRREHDRQSENRNVVDLVKAGRNPPFAPGSVV